VKGSIFHSRCSCSRYLARAAAQAMDQDWVLLTVIVSKIDALHPEYYLKTRVVLTICPSVQNYTSLEGAEQWGSAQSSEACMKAPSIA